MKNIINHWYDVSVFLAGLTALLAVFLPLGTVQKYLLAAIVIMLLHFFEEFGFPGGFPLMGMQALMHSDETDSTKWDCNNLSSMFGNWGFLLLLYVLPLLLPDVRFLTLSAMLFLFMEVLMHLVFFPLRLKTFYNAGQVTAVLGLGVIGCHYFLTAFDARAFAWYDWPLAVVWFVAVFLFSFRSKLYWGLGRKAGYALTEQTAYGTRGFNRK